ncbi:hypothetical protein EI77_02024 [Prosthecobacter fusiformis]|uniref:Outer membrane lipoprotein-sorting protein n=1 Tax=Prosthecobacter fusiformis TaxID=48464 RepID=A0A4R7S0E5_9BACT|nr:hypothetical protein [Prosthecobacter fusiformis]TDU70906.1 hypothetical protein EI77_02024 [Prosthecobacter fusiformis]
MTLRILCTLLCLLATFPSHGQTVSRGADVQRVIDQVMAEVGGKDKLLTLFRMKETFHSGAKPTPDEGKKATVRVSVVEPPKYWWIGKKERADEPAKFDVWAWSLGVLMDPKTQVEIIPDLTHEGPPLFGLSVSGTIDPPMDLYFDKETKLLRRIGWRADYYLFSDWKEHDGVKYASKTVIYKKATGNPWFFHEITEIERLKELPAGLKRP